MLIHRSPYQEGYYAKAHNSAHPRLEAVKHERQEHMQPAIWGASIGIEGFDRSTYFSKRYCLTAFSLRANSISDIPNFLACFARAVSGFIDALITIDFTGGASVAEVMMTFFVLLRWLAAAFLLRSRFSASHRFFVCTAARLAISICSSVAGPG